MKHLYDIDDGMHTVLIERMIRLLSIHRIIGYHARRLVPQYVHFAVSERQQDCTVRRLSFFTTIFQ